MSMYELDWRIMGLFESDIDADADGWEKLLAFHVHQPDQEWSARGGAKSVTETGED